LVQKIGQVTPASIDCPPTYCPGAQNTVATGINDAGQIVGYSYGASGESGFLYYKGKFYPVNCPGALYTQPWGISGNGTIVGSYSDQNNYFGFVEYAQPPNWTGTCNTIPCVFLYGINNNSQETGSTVTPPSMMPARTEGFLFSYPIFLTLFPYMGGNTVAYSTDDFEQTVGSSGFGGPGFLALPSPP